MPRKWDDLSYRRFGGLGAAVTATCSGPGVGAFAHPALFYRSEREYLDVLAPFIVDGLAKGQAVLVAVPQDKLAVLRDELGAAAAAITMANMCQVGRNPGRILGAVLGRFADQHADRPVRVIGEPIWPSRSQAEYPACVQHEALINAAFAGRDLMVLCPYDAVGLGPEVLADARMTHPVLWQGEFAQCTSPDYAPEEVRARYNVPLPTGPAALTYTVHTVADLAGARRFAARYGKLLGLSAPAIADAQLIVTELATNSIEHTDGACWLALWEHDGHLICQAKDNGHLDDPLAGRRPVRPDSCRGRGLFLVNEVADLVRAHTSAHGTTVQAYLGVERLRGEAA